MTRYLIVLIIGLVLAIPMHVSGQCAGGQCQWSPAAAAPPAAEWVIVDTGTGQELVAAPAAPASCAAGDCGAGRRHPVARGVLRAGRGIGRGAAAVGRFLWPGRRGGCRGRCG